MKRIALVVTLLAGALVVTSCDSTAGSTNVSIANVSLSVNPSPITAEASSDPNFRWVARFTLTITESAGTGATVGSLNAVLNEATAGIIITGATNEAYTVHVSAGSNRLEARGSLQVQFEIPYTLPNGGREARIDLTVSLTDDNSAALQKTAQVNVQ